MVAMPVVSYREFVRPFLGETRALYPINTDTFGLHVYRTRANEREIPEVYAVRVLGTGHGDNTHFAVKIECTPREWINATCGIAANQRYGMFLIALARQAFPSLIDCEVKQMLLLSDGWKQDDPFRVKGIVFSGTDGCVMVQFVNGIPVSLSAVPLQD